MNKLQDIIFNNYHLSIDGKVHNSENTVTNHKKIINNNRIQEENLSIENNTSACYSNMSRDLGDNVTLTDFPFQAIVLDLSSHSITNQNLNVQDFVSSEGNPQIPFNIVKYNVTCELNPKASIFDPQRKSKGNINGVYLCKPMILNPEANIFIPGRQKYINEHLDLGKVIQPILNTPLHTSHKINAPLIINEASLSNAPFSEAEILHDFNTGDDDHCAEKC